MVTEANQPHPLLAASPQHLQHSLARLPLVHLGLAPQALPAMVATVVMVVTVATTVVTVVTMTAKQSSSNGWKAGKCVTQVFDVLYRSRIIFLYDT